MKIEVRTYGGIMICNAEREILSLPPKTLLYPKVSLSELDLNSEVAKVKARWDWGKNRDFDSNGIPHFSAFCV